jgi:hypothetical protein
MAAAVYRAVFGSVHRVDLYEGAANLAFGRLQHYAQFVALCGRFVHGTTTLTLSFHTRRLWTIILRCCFY